MRTVHVVKAVWHAGGMSADLVRTGEAARHLGVAKSTITRAVQDGKLKPTDRTPGGQMRWNLADLERQWRKFSEESGGDLTDAQHDSRG